MRVAKVKKHLKASYIADEQISGELPFPKDTIESEEAKIKNEIWGENKTPSSYSEEEGMFDYARKKWEEEAAAEIAAEIDKKIITELIKLMNKK